MYKVLKLYIKLSSSDRRTDFYLNKKFWEDLIACIPLITIFVLYRTSRSNTLICVPNEVSKTI
jgi:hypothetical protein